MLILLLLVQLLSFSFDGTTEEDKKPIPIRWVETVPGNFSFVKKWSYPEGIYRNKAGQLACDGICPDEIAKMVDSNGTIYKDSIKSYYIFVDTTHMVHSIKSEAWCYEWAGTNFIQAERQGNRVHCFTETNIATHCSLQLDLEDGKCSARIVLHSVASPGKREYFLKGGTILIDKKLWQKGLLKASFDLRFLHPENPSKPMYWKGKIYTKIKNAG